MFVRGPFIASLLGIVGCASTALANSCANVDVMGTFDESGLRESEYGIYAAGTFRVEGEQDESKQPMFNLATINCEKQSGGLECKVIQAVVYANSGKPDTDKPNCSLDIDASDYSMKELQRGVVTGMQLNSSGCFNSILTIDRNTKRVYLSFTRTASAANIDKKLPSTCTLPRTEVLMNCTGWPRFRKSKHGQDTPPRYCDFSGSDDK